MTEDLYNLYKYMLLFGARVKQVKEIADNVYLVSIETPMHQPIGWDRDDAYGWLSHHKLVPNE